MAAVSGRNVLTVGSRTFPGLGKSVPGSTMRPSGANGVSRPRSAGPKRSSTAPTGVAGRVRVAVRLRPRNAEELAGDADFGDCVELLPEMKRLKLRKNNWECDTYQFDEVLSDTSSQKRVYEVVAKPVVESVLEGYNGTVMAYGQTGTGKTYTLGRIDEEDSANRGIMVRAMEDIIADINPECDSVQVSYLQLYMETVQDLLAPEKDNIPIAEDPKTGDISILGATVVQITNQRSFVELLLMGETNRIAANTKMNTESSRSHAILLVQVKKCKAETAQVQAENGNGIPRGQRAPTIRKSKLLIVDLAGSERVDKSGSEGLTLEEAKFINLSLTALGKCINALAENSPHVPTRDSKLTRLLRDSFGGTARTSLIITIGPSPKHRGETSSTILFGQRAMKVENMLKLKEEFDYKSLCRRLEADLDRLTADNERQIKALADAEEELEEKLEEAEACVVEAEEKLADTLKILSAEREAHEKERSEFLHKLEIQQNTAKSLQKQLEEQMESVINEKENHVHSERTKHQKELAGVQSKHQKEMEEVMRKHQKELKEMSDKLEEEKFQRAKIDQMKELQYDNDRSKHQKDILEIMQKYQKDIDDLQQKLQLERAQREGLEKDLANLQSDKERKYYKEMDEVKQRLQFEKTQRERLEKNLVDIQSDRNKVPEPEDTHYADEILQLKGMLERECQVRNHIEQELQALQSQEKDKRTTNRAQGDEIVVLRQKLEEETKQREKLEDEVKFLKQQIAQESEIKRTDKGGSGRSSLGSESPLHLHRPNILRDTINGQRATIAKLFEQVGLQKILSLLKSDDADVRVHAVKVVANLAAEEANQEKIVEEGGLGSLLSLLQSNEDETIRRVAAGAVANLAMNETNQELIMGQGGISLLAKTADDAEDPQTLRMVAGAIANLCGNEKLQSKLREEGGIRGLLGMVRLRHTDVLAQVARGLANFAKCESRRVAVNGQRTAKSFLIEDGALPWIVANANNEAAPIRRHIELALCHLAQHEVNAKDLVAGGALWELVRVSRECSREDIRTLAQRTLNASPTFQAELRRLHVVA